MCDRATMPFRSGLERRVQPLALAGTDARPFPSPPSSTMVPPCSSRTVFATLIAGACIWISPTVSAADVEPRTMAIRGIFTPFQTDQASLAPDGKHLAFEKHEGERLFLELVDLETNHVVELPLMSDVAAPLSGIAEKVPSRIT